MAETDPTSEGAQRSGARVKRRLPGRVLSVAACLLVLIALVAPNETSRLTPAAFLRIPVEALLGVAIVLVLPTRARPLAALGGAALGLLTIMKILDMGFFSVLARPFDPVLDWILFDDALHLLTDSAGRPGAIAILVAAVVIAVAVLGLATTSVLHLARLTIRHRTTATRAVVVLAPLWITCALLGAQLVPDTPVAAHSAATLVYDRALQVRAGLADQQAFTGQAAVDAFRDTPPEELLTALRGKDVVFSFVESYGRDAVEDPEFATQVGAVLDAGTQRLDTAGYSSRSAFLTSPVVGGGSWLAHATFLSGLWIDNEQRYRTLVASDRLTLTSAFRRASWRTVGVMPGLSYAWPEGDFYGYDQVYDEHHLGYHGPRFSWASMPDQFTLSAFERDEHGAPGHPPLMAEIPLVSSHWPWAPLPRLVDWNDVGDGSIYHPMAADGEAPDAVLADPTRVRTEYRRSIEYSLSSLISYVETYGDENLVLVVLGDHQPTPAITGDNASHDVPITVVTRDRAVLDRIAAWDWTPGLRPAPHAPVWRMDSFRDRFLTTFGPPSQSAQAGQAGQAAQSPSHPNR